MNQVIVEQDKNGGELVVEFLNIQKSSRSPDRLEQMLKFISDTYGCSPEELDITDADANSLINKLYLIASARELAVANMVFGSR
jgi:hypothetical protein